MKNLGIKLVSLLATCCISANIASGMPVIASSSIESVFEQLTTSELEVCEIMSSDFGFESVQAMFEENMRSFDPSDYSNSIHDIDGDHSITVTDASCVLNFVNGKYSYNLSYESLDVDGNLVINETDAYIYLQFAVYMQIHPELTNYFSGGSGSAPSSANEERTYVKHNYSAGSSPSINDIVYTIESDGTVTTQTNPWTDPNYSPSASYDEPDANLSIRTNPFTRVQDTRVVRCSGTGFIIGEHTILTNAHCVYGSGGYNTTADVSAFTFDSNNEPIRHDLTVLSYYVPMAYIDSNYSDISINITNDLIEAYHDYAIIVVQEDLTSYGMFKCGIPLEGLANDTITTNTASYGFPQDEFGMCQVTENGVTYRKYTVASYGEVDGFARGYWIRTTETEQTRTGMSGSPIVLNSVSYNNITISCDETVIGISRSGPSSRGDSIVTPILQFCYNNSILENQLYLL